VSDFTEMIRRALEGDDPSRKEEVRPDFGLTGAQILPAEKSQYEPTLAPGEKRTPEDLQSMLAGVIEAAAMSAVPGVGPHTPETRAPGRVYHGTNSSRGIRSEPGLHVGTPEQAAWRIRDPLTGKIPEGGRVYPLEMNPRKVVDIKDLKNAMDFPGNVAEELVRVGAITPEERGSLRSMSEVFSLLKSKGYDAMRYPNRVEGEGPSYEIIDPSILSPAFKAKR
jgi:hypothetical protein